MNDHVSSDGELVRAVRAGRENAYKPLVERHQERVYRLCFHVCGDSVYAEDLAHDAFVEAYLKLDQIRDPERFGPWLRAIALNLCRLWYRQHRRFRELPPDEHTCEMNGDHDEAADDYAAVYLGVSRLSAHYRLVLELHYWEGLSYEETARFLDVPIGTVMSRLHRARHELRLQMQQNPEEEGTTFMPAVADDFKREVEAEIRVLLSLFRGDPNARERLSVLLIRTPERLVQMIREAEDAQTLENLALLLPRLGAPGVETMLAAYFGTDTTLRINVALLLARFVAQGRSMSGEAVAVTRLAGRGMYLLMDRLIRFPSADPVARAELLTDLLAEAGKQDRTALLLMNTLLCWPEAALPVLLERYRRAATPEDLFRPADILYALCRTGTQFATAALIPSLRTGGGDSWEEIRALCGAEALARTLNIDWLDLGTVPDEQVALDARLRRKWAVPLRRDRDPAILRDLAAAVAALPSGNNLDRSVDTQDRAVRTLGHLRAREFLEPVLAAARRGAPTTRLTALRALADIADPRAAGLLIETTRSEDPAERRLAVEALGSLADPGCVPVLSEMLGDPDREVRRAALFALREIGSAEAAEAIRQAAMSPEPSVREAAARALSAVQHKQARTATPPADVRRMADIVRGGATPTTFISLEAVLRALPEVRPYTEQEITRCIAQACSDYSTTRRYLVEEGVLRRERGVYELTEVGQSVWRVERFLRDRYMQWGRML